MDDGTGVETIFALASGLVPSAVAVVRISGPGVRFGLDTMVGGAPEPRHLALKTIRGSGGDILDRGLVTFFPKPDSFDGEDVAELHLHGGPAVVTAVLEQLAKLPGFRMAEPGEFTRRAFHNGKMDLLEVEGLADLVASETEAQRRQATGILGGAPSRRLDDWRKRLVRVRAYIEGEFDFSDEEDVPDTASEEIWEDLEALRDELLTETSSRSGEVVRDGISAVVLGPPNVGKSSLVNALAKRDVAIVSDVPGTTRDLIEVRLDLNGIPLTLIDTAGLREGSSDVIELEGMRRGMARAETAELTIGMAEVLAGQDRPTECDLWVGTKIDKATPSQRAAVADSGFDCVVSMVTGEGLDELVERLSVTASGFTGNPVSGVVTRARHREALVRCASAIDESLSREAPLEIRAESLRRATDELGRVTGQTGVEDLLDVIFADFCVGK